MSSVLIAGPLATAGAQSTASDAASRDRAAADPELQPRPAAGTGLLPNFEAQGPHLIRLLAGAFDPLADPLPAPAGVTLLEEATLPPGVAQYWLVQVQDDRFRTVTEAVEQAGASIAGTLRDDTYMVRATPAQRALIAGHPAVRWTGYYQPAWRVPVAAGGKPGLLDLGGTRQYRVHVFAHEPDPASVRQALQALPGVQVLSSSGITIDVRATAAQVPAIAAIPAVEWVGMEPRAVLLNANARWVNDTGIRDVFAATAPGRLTGAGQTAAVADTGLNYKYDLNGRAHIAFRDCDSSGVCKEAIYTQEQPGTDEANMHGVIDHGTGHRKMVAYFDLGATGPNPFDESSHGSHTGGSVDGDQPPYDEYTGDDGLAPAANHVHQNVGTSSGGLALPGDDYELWRQAYRPRKPASVATSSPATGNPVDGSAGCVDPPDPDETTVALSTCYRPLEDARTHNNSYGLIVPVIDEGSAVRLDQFVWDHEDMVIVVSAGNGGPSVGTIGSPSVAKNELSSGASANGRQPMASIDSMASFSSHGPTADGRIGVDVATPGQIVVSVKGGSDHGYHVAQGTSMSAPVLTGLATLVRQYFWDGYGPAGGKGFAGGDGSLGRRHNPSAALVKATLINGAERMRGWYTGDEGSQRAADGQWPSAGQGFGRVTLDNSLYFSNDPVNTWYHDVWRADAEAFPLSNLPASRSYEIHAEAGQPLDVTLSWTDAPDLLPAGTPALVNNLDLTVEGPDGTIYVGNNMNTRATPSADVETTLPGPAAADTRNLSERVRIAAPTTGTYTITVDAAPIIDGNQGFALAASGLISPANDGGFTPGPPIQQNQPGSPSISNVVVDAVSADTALITFTTNEPTTASAELTLAGGLTTFVDSYNEGLDGFPGLDEGPVETSAEYADKPVVGTHHEILITGTEAGQTYPVTLTATDLEANEITAAASLLAPTNVYQSNAGDTGQCIELDATCQWRTGTQLYGGDSAGDGLLGAFMFRVPETAIDPADITAARVVLRSSHNWVVPYTDDPWLWVDLIDEAEEPQWGTQDYTQIRNAPSEATLNPETTLKVGDYKEYSFEFGCGQLEQLKQTLTTVSGGLREAPFRYVAEPATDGLFSMEFGFNRRSKGPEMRPMLVLSTAQDPESSCDPGTPAPAIFDVGIQQGRADDGSPDDTSVTVSWETDVSSDSMVLFREQGTTDWTQVGTLERTTVHGVQVFGLDSSLDYEFVVRSRACNGAESTDTNGGSGYDFFRDPPPVLATTDYFFHGMPTDEAVKQASDPPYPPDTLTFSTAPPDGTAGTQTTTPFANEDFVGNALEAFWTGPFSDTLDTDVVLRWYWSTTNATAVAFGAEVQVTFFADPDYTAANRVQPEKIIGRSNVNLTFTAPGVPTLNVHHIPVSGTVNQELLIQVESIFVDTGQGLTVHYDENATPSNFGVPSGPPPPPGDNLPLTGPVPPPSAGATGLTAPPTRVGPASAADIAAGTAACVVQGQADLGVSKTDSPDPVEQGQTLTYQVTVTNDGPEEATNVVLTDVLPPGVEFLSATPAQGTCNGTGPVTCDLGTIGPGGSVGVTIEVRPQLAGRIVNSASVTSDSLDTNPANDTARANTIVTTEPMCHRSMRRLAGNHIVGTEGPDTIEGTEGRDIICGRGGVDTINGLDGDDVIDGGRGGDIIDGGVGEDRILGMDGDDTINGGSENDFVRGGPKDDIVHGDDGADTVIGNKGADDLFGEAGNDTLRGLDNIEGNDDLDGGTDTDECKSNTDDTEVNCEA